jgi:archaellin
MCGHVLSTSFSATFNTNSDSMAAIILNDAGQGDIKIREVRITTDDGTATDTPDYHKRIKFGTTTNTTSGSAGTVINVDRSRNWFWTGVRKGPGTGYTLDSTIDTFSVHSATDFIWRAADDDDKIVIPTSTNFIVEINPAG